MLSGIRDQFQFSRLLPRGGTDGPRLIFIDSVPWGNNRTPARRRASKPIVDSGAAKFLILDINIL